MLQINTAYPQAIYQIKWISDSTATHAVKLLLVDDHSFIDSTKCIQKIIQVINKLAEQSYLTAGVSNIRFNDSLCLVTINPGNSYKWINLSGGNIPEDIFTASGWRQNLFYNQVFNYQIYAQKIIQIISYLEQNGYPFAQIKLDSVEVLHDGVSAVLNIDKGDLVKFDTIEIIGDASIKSWYVAKYLGIKKDALYNEQILKRIDARLSQLSFIQTTRPSLIYFVGATAKPVVYLTNKKSSSIDGIIGFAPSSNNNENKLLITGEANLNLHNLFGTGKGFDLAFRSFLSGSQELKTRITWPYIARSNMGVDYELNLLKFDSTFLDVKHVIGLQYKFVGSDYLKVFYNIQSTSLLYVDTNALRITKALPLSNDLKVHLYGLSAKVVRYDYYLNPRKGFGFDVSAAVGSKQIIRNPTVDAIKFAQPDGSVKSSYDSIKLSSTQYRLLFKGDLFIPLTQRSTIRVEGNFGHVQSPVLFFSELFRLGGIRTLKGFDEQAIFASSYGIINTEIRYLLQQNSHVMLFWNGAWYQNTIRKPTIEDTPYGFGVGLNFETGAGVFSLYYAVGKQFNNSVEFNEAKIHFGFVNYF